MQVSGGTHYPRTINTQRFPYYSSLPIQITISLIWGFSSFEPTVQDIDTLHRAECSKDQPAVQFFTQICDETQMYVYIRYRKKIFVGHRFLCDTEYVFQGPPSDDY
jgi:hypothetical protein